MMKKKVHPFSNGSEFMFWHEHNCDICNKYESGSTERSKAGCPLAFDIDFSMASDGSIPLSTAKWIGWNGKELNPKCNMLNIKWIKNVKFDRSVINQLRLF